jgi:chloramphenicol-sensitive protein RarD
MGTVQWVGFVLVWLALALFTADALAHRKSQLRLTAQAAAI